MAPSAEEELKKDVTDLFAAARGGHTLANALVLALVQYFVDVVEVDDVTQVKLDKRLVDDARLAWESTKKTDLPPFHEAALLEWIGGGKKSSVINLSSSRSGCMVGVIPRHPRDSRGNPFDTEVFCWRGPTVLYERNHTTRSRINLLTLSTSDWLSVASARVG